MSDLVNYLYYQNQERLASLAKKHEEDFKEVKEMDLMGDTAMNQAVHICHNIQVQVQVSSQYFSSVMCNLSTGLSLLPWLPVGKYRTESGKEEKEEKEEKVPVLNKYFV